MIFNDSILVLFPLVPMLFLLIIMVLYHKSHSKYLSENVLFIFYGAYGVLEPLQRIGTFEEDQRRYWTNRILREKGVLSPETIFKKIKPANDTYQVWVSIYHANVYHSSIADFCSKYIAQRKVGCVFPIVVSILPHAEFGSNYHREDATHFMTFFIVSTP